MISRGGPGTFTTPAKPDGVDDYGNPLIAQRLRDGTTLADTSLATLIAAGENLSQKKLLTAIQAAGGKLEDSDGLTLASMNVNDVRVALSHGGQGREVVMAASDKSVVATVKPLTESGYSMDVSGNLNRDVSVGTTGVSLPLGLFDFTVSLDPSTNSTTVVIVPPTPFASTTKWYKVVDGVLVEYPNFLVDPSGNGILTLYDNDSYDRNKAFGIIRDPGGPGIAGGGGSGCFIATAAFGSYFHPAVKILRAFRDTVLLTSSLGRAFVEWYYRVSPPIADVIKTSTVMKAGMRLALLPIVGITYLSLAIGLFPAFAVLLLLATGGCIGLRCLYRRRRSCIDYAVWRRPSPPSRGRSRLPRRWRVSCGNLGLIKPTKYSELWWSQLTGSHDVRHVFWSFR